MFLNTSLLVNKEAESRHSERECDEEAHLPGDSKQSGNKENVDENNSVYF